MVDLEKELHENQEIISLVIDDDFAVELYRALCNMRWKKRDKRDEAEILVDILTGVDPTVWSCSWRYAGGIVSDLRNTHHGKSEIYLDYYCAGNEGLISDRVNEILGRMGWTQLPWNEE